MSLCVGVLGLVYALGVVYGAHPMVFVLYSLILSAVALLSFTGLGPNALKIIFTPASWMVGLSNIAVEAGYAYLVAHVPPADGSLMIRMSIPVTLLIGVIVFGRRPGVWSGSARRLWDWSWGGCWRASTARAAGRCSRRRRRARLPSVCVPSPASSTGGTAPPPRSSARCR